MNNFSLSGTQKILILLVLFPGVVFLFSIINGGVNPFSNIFAIVFTSIIPILGIVGKKPWVYGYIYFGVSLGVLSIPLMIIVGISYGMGGVFIIGTEILYILLIFYFTRKLQKQNKTTLGNNN